MNTGIVVIGSTNIDLVMKMERLPRLYETVGDATFIQSFGGKGANQAVGAARATGVGGVPVNFVGCVGDDSYSALTLNNLQKAGVRTDFVFQETGVASGTALIMIGGNGENYITLRRARITGWGRLTLPGCMTW